eukprot:ctg_1305.g431
MKDLNRRRFGRASVWQLSAAEGDELQAETATDEEAEAAAVDDTLEAVEEEACGGEAESPQQSMVREVAKKLPRDEDAAADDQEAAPRRSFLPRSTLRILRDASAETCDDGEDEERVGGNGTSTDTQSLENPSAASPDRDASTDDADGTLQPSAVMMEGVPDEPSRYEEELEGSVDHSEAQPDMEEAEGYAAPTGITSVELGRQRLDITYAAKLGWTPQNSGNARYDPSMPFGARKRRQHREPTPTAAMDTADMGDAMAPALEEGMMSPSEPADTEEPPSPAPKKAGLLAFLAKVVLLMQRGGAGRWHRWNSEPQTGGGSGRRDRFSRRAVGPEGRCLRAAAGGLSEAHRWARSLAARRAVQLHAVAGTVGAGHTAPGHGVGGGQADAIALGHERHSESAAVWTGGGVRLGAAGAVASSMRTPTDRRQRQGACNDGEAACRGAASAGATVRPGVLSVGSWGVVRSHRPAGVRREARGAHRPLVRVCVARGGQRRRAAYAADGVVGV